MDAKSFGKKGGGSAGRTNAGEGNRRMARWGKERGGTRLRANWGKGGLYVTIKDRAQALADVGQPHLDRVIKRRSD